MWWMIWRAYMTCPFEQDETRFYIAQTVVALETVVPGRCCPPRHYQCLPRH